MRISPFGLITGTKGVPQSAQSIGSKTPMSTNSFNCFSILVFHANGIVLGGQKIGLTPFSIGKDILLKLYAPNFPSKTDLNCFLIASTI